MTAATQPAKAARKPTRLERAAQRTLKTAAKAAAPYVGGFAVSAVAGAALHSPDLPMLALGAGGMHAGMRLREAYGWHRSGGKAAARKRRRYQGTATRRELQRKLSLAAVRRNTKIMRPSLAGHTRRLPPAEAGILIGTARVKPSLRVYAGWRDSLAAFGPPGSGKTNWMAQVGLTVPGAAYIGSTRADLARDTVKARSGIGPVYFINPSGDGGWSSTLRSSPLAGCEDHRTAMESAGALMYAAPRDSSGKDAWWDHQAKVFLQQLMHAAALADGANILNVRNWAANPLDLDLPVKILAACGAPDWADELAATAEMAAADEKFRAGLSSGAVTALSWLSDRALAEMACPPRGGEFDVRQFIRDRGTVYVIGADTPHNPAAQYFAWFATRLWNEAKRMAADPSEPASTRLRLDPPLTIIADEPAVSLRTPLDRWSAEAGGHGIVIVTGFQSLAQTRQVWGEHGGQVLMDNMTVKLVFGGVTNNDLLKAASGWGGMRDTWDHVKGPDGGKTRQPRQELAFPEERLRNLALGEAYVVHRNTRAFIAQINPVDDHPRYEPIDPAAIAAAVEIPAPQLAIEAPRNAIPLAASAVAGTAPITSPEEEPKWQHESSSALGSIRG